MHHVNTAITAAAAATRRPGTCLRPPCRPWYRRPIDMPLDRWLEPTHGAMDLRELDPRTLADLGLHPSELGSIDAEWHGPRHAVTRRRILTGTRP